MTVKKHFEGGGHGLPEVTIPAFAWRHRGKPQSNGLCSAKIRFIFASVRRLFNVVVSNSDCVVNSELEGMWKEAVVA
jgi:hypothetical protein